MKNLKKIFSLLTFLLCLSCFSLSAADIDRMQGLWSVTKKTDQGIEYKQEIEIKDSGFVFRVYGQDDKVAIYAKGKVETEKAGTLKVVKFTDIKAGSSADNIEPIYDNRTGVYRLGYNTFTVAMNFDGYRDEDPTVDVYKKVKK